MLSPNLGCFYRAILFAAACCASLGGCQEKKLTQLVVVIEGDLDVPADVTHVRVVVEGLGSEAKQSTGTLSAENPYPRQVTVVRDDPQVTNVVIRLVGEKDGAFVIEQKVRVPFAANETRFVTLSLLRSCLGVTCASAEESCGAGGCRSLDAQAQSDRDPNDGGTPGSQECTPAEEVCNGLDDDCDTQIDEGFLFSEDVNHCGSCGRSCGADERCSEGQCRKEGAAVSVSAGRRYTCVLTAEERVRCWGDNTYCQLAAPDQDGGPTPVQLSLSGVKQISAGYQHICSLTGDGVVRCWGNNEERQSATNGDERICAPFVIGLPATASAVASGRDHSCAIVGQDRQVYCWGGNAQGQLGRRGGLPIPGVVGELPGPAKSIASGDAFSCAALESGEVYCWGRRDFGQLGSLPNGRRRPVLVPGVSGVASVAVGARHACALLANQTIICWGDNREGQLGRDDIESQSPAPVAAVESVVSLSLGARSSCAVGSGGMVQCWGDDNDGQLGNGVGGPSASAQLVPSLSDVRSVSAGRTHVCTTQLDGTVRCWGNNDGAQLGRVGDPGDTTVPAPVSAIP